MQDEAAARGVNEVGGKLRRPDGTLVATTVTATNAGNAGYYFFGDLLPGDYKVDFVINRGGVDGVAWGSAPLLRLHV